MAASLATAALTVSTRFSRSRLSSTPTRRVAPCGVVPSCDDGVMSGHVRGFASVADMLAFAAAVPGAIRRNQFLPSVSSIMSFNAKGALPRCPSPVRMLSDTSPTGVDSSKLNRSDEIAFVRRQRHYAASPETTYTVDPSSVHIGSHRDEPALLAILSSADSSRPSLRLALFLLERGIFRVIVDDLVETAHERPPTPDILLSRTKAQPLSKYGLEIGEHQARLHMPGGCDGVSAVVDFSPFGVSVESDDGVVISRLNSNGRLRLEDFVARPGEDAPSPEHFRNYSDPVSRGPESVGLDVEFPSASVLHGLPQRTMPTALPDTVSGSGVAKSEPFRLYNLDVTKYKVNSPIGLYGTIPFVVSRDNEAKRCAGALWLNASETYVDTSSPAAGGRSTHWFSETGVVDVLLLPGPRVQDVWSQYLFLTGEPTFQQRFVMGYHQCRYSYLTQTDAAQVDKKFDELDIPYDVLWLDVDHTDGKRYFTWDKTAYPKPDELIGELGRKSRNVVTIVDPHIKVDAGYHIHDMATAGDLYIKDASGKALIADCWPGKSSWLDFSNPRAREQWALQFSAERYDHFAENSHIWNDMNEPAVFGGPEQTLPKSALHAGNVEHRHVHNLYGHGMIAATYEGLMRGKKGKQRPFILTRSFFAGSQRFAAVWSGDNAAEWEHLRASVPMLLQMQLAGIGLAGADVGGFLGNPTAELATRWFQAGAMQPFFRGHANDDTARAEPWVYGEQWCARIREAIRVRYRMLPTLYTLSAAASVGAIAGFRPDWIGPVMRPVWWEFGGDDDDRAWMVGRALLVAPVMHPGVRKHAVRLPPTALWYDLLHPTRPGGEVEAAAHPGPDVELDVDLERMVVMQRGGTVIAQAASLDGVRASDAVRALELVVAPDAYGRAVGEVYVDDGQSLEFTAGAFVTAEVTLGDHGDSVVRGRRIGGAQGFVAGERGRVQRVTVLGARRAGMQAATEVRVSGNVRAVRTRYDADTDVLTVDDVNVQLSDNWSIELL